MTLTPDQFNEFSNLAWDIGGEVYENYSGRGMFGKNCLGITVENLEHGLFRLGRAIGEEDFSFMVKEVENFRTDNLGRDYIIYFPKLQKEVDNK